MKLYMLTKDIFQVANDGTVKKRHAYFYGKTKEEAKFHYLESKKKPANSITLLLIHHKKKKYISVTSFKVKKLDKYRGITN